LTLFFADTTFVVLFDVDGLIQAMEAKKVTLIQNGPQVSVDYNGAILLGEIVGEGCK
jgi:hypothetical protein